jgi:hypothetical protein
LVHRRFGSTRSEQLTSELIDTIELAGALVGRLAAEAEDVLRRRGAEVLI